MYLGQKGIYITEGQISEPESHIPYVLCSKLTILWLWVTEHHIIRMINMLIIENHFQ